MSCNIDMQTRSKKYPIQKTRKYKRTLRSSYGYIRLPKGMCIYHASKSELCVLPEKPILFTTYHPSEWYTEDAYISVIELQKDIDLLFMIQNIRGLRIFSSLSNYLEPPGNNMSKMNYENCKKWIPYLQKESLSGWISSIENKTAIEFAIINDPSILKIVKCNPIQYNWKNATYTNEGTFVPKQWGNIYSISNKRVKMHIHRRFKPQIESYIETILQEDKNGTAFSLLLDRADISYFDANIEKIRWI